MTNVLFVCSRNQWRSPTALRIFGSLPDVNVRSAGTSPRARRTVALRDVEWADLIFVMEQKHLDRLEGRFPDATRLKPVHVLEIADEYRFMDPELVEVLRESVTPFLSSG